MNVAGRSSCHKVGPNDSKPNHEPGRGQIKTDQRATTLRNHAVFTLRIVNGAASGVKPRGRARRVGRYNARMEGALARRAAGALALALAASAARAGSVEGEYASPLGRVRIVLDGAGYRGTLAERSATCGFAAGEEILRATLLDDSLAGQLRVCLSGPRCRAAEEGASVVLLAGPAGLSGAAHVAAAGCTTPLGRRGGLRLARIAGPGSTDAPPTSSASPAPATPITPASTSAASPPAARSQPKTSATPTAARGRGEARALLREGRALLDEGRFETARARFLAAVEVAPDVPEAYNGVGVTFRMRNALGEAIAWYKRALSVDPDFGDAYYNMACVYAQQGRADLALRYLQIAALNGYASGEGLDVDPDLEPLRDRAEYRALRSRMGP